MEKLRDLGIGELRDWPLRGRLKASGILNIEQGIMNVEGIWTEGMLKLWEWVAKG